MKQWRIKTKRDWAVAALFLLLLSYLLASRFQQRMNEWLMDFSPEKMSYFNQPEMHGVYLLAVLLAAVFGTVLWLWQRRMEKRKAGRGLIILWVLAVILEAGIWSAYQSECRQIVNTPYSTDLKPQVHIFSWDVELPEPLELTEEEQQKVLDLCLNLEALSKDEQERMREQMPEEELISLQISYPTYKNHSYHLWFFLEDDMLCLNRGHNKYDAVFYDGTEAKELVEEILEAHRE